MNIVSILVVLLVAILIIFVLKLISGLMKAFIYTFIIFIIAAGLFSYFVYTDTKSLASGIANNDTLFLLKDKNELITGFTLSRLNISSVDSLGSVRLDDLNTYYSKKDYKKMLGDNYKMFMIDRSVFPKDTSFDPDSVIDYIKFQNKKESVISDIKESSLPDPQAMAFSMLVIYSIRENPSFLIDGYKSGNITIYPETFIFKIMKFMTERKK